ncbi:hypothetical protein [Rhodoplanes roseus]|uniref:Uncharacterized protein n=1 Tax=Rhodoplanes roseus TaxID=29409 RepID=A0A327KR05_9BRAD|nr:hypothetical protein [Rhodoplanes roseus]RAI37768.1 hypothetical protein CH341_29080 [Rhodoplanes roseus]
MKHLLAVLLGLLAILTWTFGGTVIELESYREANSQGLCHVVGVDYSADGQARQVREQCLAAAKSSTGPFGHILHALHLR